MSLHRFLALFILVAVLALIFGQPGSVSGYADLDPIQDQEPPYPLPTDIPTEVLFPRTRFENLSPEELSAEGTMIEPRVVGGSEVDPPNSYPWMVSQQYYDYHYCGGMLIDAEWVLTAAHCWVDEFGNLIGISAGDFVVLGEHSLSTASGIEQEIAPYAVYIHPLFNHTNLKYDLALVHLSKSAELNANVQPIAILTSPPPDYQGAIVTGWGDTIEGGASSDVLLEGQIQILPDSACSNYGEFFDPNSMLCAGLPDGSIDACQGDSGGPLFFDFDGVWALAGVTSWGNGCADPDYPGVYAEVQTLEEWFMSMEFDCTAQTSSVPVEDCETLKEFFISTNGAEWKDSSEWLVNSNICLWNGLQCELVGNHEIASLNLRSNSLTGAPATDLNGLDQLAFLDLSVNSLTGDLGEMIEKLPANLWILDLSYNHLTGTIPESIDRLASLKELVLNGNQFSGDITNIFTLLPLDIEVLELRRNNFSGTIAPAVYSYDGFSDLDLSQNQFSGDIDFEYFPATTHLDLSNNNFSGTISTDFIGFSGLQTLDLCGNQFSGDIGTILTSLNNTISTIALCNNNFTGTIPNAISLKTDLYRFDLGGNQITGEVSPILNNLDKGVFELDLRSNNLSGELSDEFWWFTNLTYLDLSDNTITGDLEIITENIRNTSANLYYLNLSSNNFYGELSNNMKQHDWLEFVDLSNNQLTDTISSLIWNLPPTGMLRYLGLSGNQLTGRITTVYPAISDIYILDVSDNPITGTLPVEFQSIPHLRELLINNSNMFGKLPTELTNLSSLDTFHFNNTNICVPNQTSIQTWLASIPDLASTNVACESTPPTLSVISPKPGENISYPRDLVIATATDFESGMQQVELHYLYEDFWVNTDIDNDGSDGWKLQLPTAEQPTNQLVIKVVARDHHDNATTIQIGNLKIAQGGLTNTGGYEARTGGGEHTADPVTPQVVLPPAAPELGPPGNHKPATRLYLY